MTWTAQQYIDRTRSVADATGSADWDNTLDVLPALGLAHTREWKRILNANQYVRVNQLSVSPDTTGQIALAALDAGSGDTQQRFYRVLWVTDGSRLYTQTDFGAIPLGATRNAGINTSVAGAVWYRTDSALQLLPITTAAITVAVNHTPTPIDQLDSTGSDVEFPRDYELVLCYEAAAWIVAKGGRETGTTADFQRLADQIRSDMLGDLTRDSTTPTWMRFPDTAAQWGGW